MTSSERSQKLGSSWKYDSDEPASITTSSELPTSEITSSEIAPTTDDADKNAAISNAEKIRQDALDQAKLDYDNAYREAEILEQSSGPADKYRRADGQRQEADRIYNGRVQEIERQFNGQLNEINRQYSNRS